MTIPHTVCCEVAEALGTSLDSNAFSADYSIENMRPVSGGDINQSYAFTFGGSRYFAKFNKQAPDDFFAAEAEGLQKIASIGVIDSPTVVLMGKSEDWVYLVLTHIDMRNSGSYALFGKKLANFHKKSAISHADSGEYGLSVDNYIGTTPQINTYSCNWAQFWIECRMKPQLARAFSKGHLGGVKPVEGTFYKGVEHLLEGHNPDACLLHGDLWGGNMSFDVNGAPILYDPAVYFGDRETDIALTELFGGFDHDFYTGYNSVWPLSPDYSLRRDLYNLYHLLNHLNLFGDSYASGCLRIITSIAKLA